MKYNRIMKTLFGTLIILTNIINSYGFSDSLFGCEYYATDKNTCLANTNCAWCKNTSNLNSSTCEEVFYCYLDSSSEYLDLCEFGISRSGCYIKDLVLFIVIFLVYLTCIALMMDFILNKIQKFKIDIYLLKKNNINYNTFNESINSNEENDDDQLKKIKRHVTLIGRYIFVILLQFIGSASLLLFFSNKIFFIINTTILIVFCIILLCCF